MVILGCRKGQGGEIFGASSIGLGSGKGFRRSFGDSEGSGREFGSLVIDGMVWYGIYTTCRWANVALMLSF